jgi:hypothetical protein
MYLDKLSKNPGGSNPIEWLYAHLGKDMVELSGEDYDLFSKNFLRDTYNTPHENMIRVDKNVRRVKFEDQVVDLAIVYGNHETYGQIKLFKFADKTIAKVLWANYDTVLKVLGEDWIFSKLFKEF